MLKIKYKDKNNPQQNTRLKGGSAIITILPNEKISFDYKKLQKPLINSRGRSNKFL